jgi:hypothetical protein
MRDDGKGALSSYRELHRANPLISVHTSPIPQALDGRCTRPACLRSFRHEPKKLFAIAGNASKLIANRTNHPKLKPQRRPETIQDRQSATADPPYSPALRRGNEIPRNDGSDHRSFGRYG